MSKPKNGKASYTSKGSVGTNRGTLAGVRADRSPVETAMHIMKAYEAGRNPWVTIDNPNPNETNRLKIRVKANSLWGSPKERKAYDIYGGEGKKKKSSNG